MIFLEILPHIPVKGILSGKEIRFLSGDRRIGKKYRTAFHVICPEIKKPCDIVQCCQYMYRSTLRLHFVPQAPQLVLCALPAITLFKHIDRGKGQLWPLLPDSAGKIKIPDHLTALLLRNPFKFQTLSRRNHSSVKPDIPSLEKLPLHIFLQLGNRGLPHFHKRDPASLQLSCRLDKVTSVRKQGRLVLMNHEGSRRAGEAAEILAHHEIFADILAVVIVRGGNDVTVDPRLLHRLP